MTPEPFNFVIVRDDDSSRPVLFNGSEDALEKELHTLFSDYGCSGFSIYRLASPERVEFRMTVKVTRSK